VASRSVVRERIATGQVCPVTLAKNARIPMPCEFQGLAPLLRAVDEERL
jgi:hypothetical protein